ncbi:hypothetical protein KA525_03155 [Candidatus Woesebacteria bacterium]|jgi:hypothetical protein|nr:hypothetical protein [Candidatus Woesebacteria bacterium]
MKQSKFNKELRTRGMVVNLHLLWVAFYVVAVSLIAVVAYYYYNKHKEDQFPVGSIELTVSKTRYKQGETVSFSVINHFPTTIYVNNRCPQEPLDVYKWENKQWKQIHDSAKSEDSLCFKQPRRVPVAPSSTLTYNFNDWPDLFKTPGVYRIVMKVEHYKGYPFQDFVVLKPQEIIKNATPSVILPPINNNPVPAPTKTETKEPEDEREDNNEAEDDNEVEVEN